MSDAAGEAFEHLQKAALEMIAATRAFLDLAEDVVADPAGLAAVGHLLADLAAKGRAAAGRHAEDDRPPSTGVQHIRIAESP
jgi:hypothetical protein